jgi:hypothetical protein
MPYEIRHDVADNILKHKKKRFDDEFRDLHQDHRYYRKKKKTTKKKCPGSKIRSKGKGRGKGTGKGKGPIKKQTKKKTYRRSNKEEEMMIPGVYKTVNKVEDKPKTVKHKTEIMFFPKGKKAKEILSKTGQLSKMYGKQGVSLIKKEVEYAKDWPARIDKKTEDNLKKIEEKYGPLKIKYIPEDDDDDEKESYYRAKKTTKKKPVKRKTVKKQTKKKPIKRKPVKRKSTKKKTKKK